MNVQHQPTAFSQYAQLHIGSDGRLYAADDQLALCFDRSGACVYRCQLALSGRVSIASDSAGRLYVHGNFNRESTLLRVAADGRSVEIVAPSRVVGGTLGREGHLLVAPDGTVCMLSGRGAMRVLGPRGHLVWQSETSKEDDVEHDEERERDRRLRA